MAKSGCSAAWLARLNGVQEVVGSNPATPTKLNFFQIQRRFVARSPRLRRVSLRKKPCPPALFQLRRVNISELNQRGGQIQIQFFGKANGGSFQFFPPMILFRKNHWTKQVFRRGERYLSNFAKVQSNCFPFAQNRTFFY